MAFGALARIVLVAAKQQDGTDSKVGPRVLMRAKSNIGPDDGGFNYELQLVPMRSRPDIVASVVNWGGVVYGKARDILAEAEATDDKDEATARHEAEDFLLDFLADGPKPAKECKAAARDAGHSPRTIDRAKSKLRIASVKDGMTGGWVWSLPEGGQHSSKNAKNATNPCQENLASFGNDGDLRGESEAINNGSSSAMRDSWEAEI